jgi:phosphatidylinositol glycan class P protein
MTPQAGGRQRRDSTSTSDDSQPFPALVAEQAAELPISNGGDTDEDHIVTPLEEDDDDVEVEDDADFQSHYSIENEISDSSDSEPDDEDEDDSMQEDSTPIHHRPFTQPSSSSLHGPNAFAPPFYNRPPTPLPPSPSLTSLLRPPFSTTTSRPTTPDSSDVETPNDTEAAVAKSARIATTVPRASPKVPTYEYYGFVLYLASSLAFCRSSLDNASFLSFISNEPVLF